MVDNSFNILYQHNFDVSIFIDFCVYFFISQHFYTCILQRILCQSHITHFSSGSKPIIQLTAFFSYIVFLRFKNLASYQCLKSKFSISGVKKNIARKLNLQFLKFVTMGYRNFNLSRRRTFKKIQRQLFYLFLSIYYLLLKITTLLLQKLTILTNTIVSLLQNVNGFS